LILHLKGKSTELGICPRGTEFQNLSIFSIGLCRSLFSDSCVFTSSSDRIEQHGAKEIAEIFRSSKFFEILRVPTIVLGSSSADFNFTPFEISGIARVHLVSIPFLSFVSGICLAHFV